MSKEHRSDILLAFAIAVGLTAAYFVRKPLVVIYVSALFATMISPVVDRIHEISFRGHHIRRGVALLLMAIAGILVAVVFGILIIPRIAEDLQQISVDLPHRISDLIERARNYPPLQSISPATLEQHAATIFGTTVRAFPAIATGVLGIFTSIILTVYFILDGRKAFYWAISLFPTESQPRLEATLRRAQDRMWKWLAGQALLMLILGTSSSVVYALLGLRYAMALGLFTGLANIVPIVGPVTSVLLAAGIAAIDSWTKAAGVLIFYAIYQQIENAFLTPHIMKELVGLPGLAVIIALAIGGALAGFLGAMVAVPSAALVAAIIAEYMVHPPPAKARAMD